ncbi:hypothetical protein D1872_324330 [compost metagenome]
MTREDNMSLIRPLLTMLSKMGLTQGLILSDKSLPRYTTVTSAPTRVSSSAASTAELLPPITTTFIPAYG